LNCDVLYFNINSNIGIINIESDQCTRICTLKSQCGQR
jgi:hypothetical protein